MLAEIRKTVRDKMLLPSIPGVLASIMRLVSTAITPTSLR